jgi:HlyD family secretion protein
MRERKLINTILLLLVILLHTACHGGKEESSVAKDNAGSRIMETGELEAVKSNNFNLPRIGRQGYQSKIVGILKHGTIVKPGDSIIQLDDTEIKKSIIDMESNFETQKAALAKMLVDQNNCIQDLNSKMRSDQADFDMKKLAYESSRFEIDKKKKISELEFQRAKMELAKEKRKVELVRIINACDLKVQQIRTRQFENMIKDAYKILPTLTIRTPIGGIFQVGISHNGQMIKVGDQLYNGTTMGKVPNLTWMKVNTSVGETDFMRLKIGQKVSVRLDALPKVSFKAEISNIAKLSHLKDAKSRKKVFDVEVKMLESDSRLKPGMTVSCEYLEKI